MENIKNYIELKFVSWVVLIGVYVSLTYLNTKVWYCENIVLARLLKDESYSIKLANKKSWVEGVWKI